MMIYREDVKERKKPGRKARPVKIDLEGARGNRIVRRYPDEATRDREVEKLRLAGELKDKVEWKSFDEVARLLFARIAAQDKPGNGAKAMTRTYEADLEKWFRGKSIRAATAESISALHDHIVATRPKSTWHRVYAVLRAVVKLAIARRYIPREDNPLLRLSLKRPDVTPLVLRQQEKSRELPLPALGDCLAILEHAVGWLRVALHLILLAGLRTGEVRALRWEHVELDIELELVWIHVREAVKWDGRIGPPKTKAGIRDICVRGALFELLRDRHPGKGGAKRLVVTARGTRLASNAIYLGSRALQVRIGIGHVAASGVKPSHPGTYRPHLLRHAAVAWWIWRRVPDVIIRTWIGHVHTQTTLDTYGYIIDARDCGRVEWPRGDTPTGDEIDEEEVAG
jgi:integrase